MADYRRYQPRRTAPSAHPGRWVVGVVVLVGAVLIGRIIWGGTTSKQPADHQSPSAKIRLVTDNANVANNAAPTNLANTNSVEAAVSSWTSFSTAKCPAAISTFGTKRQAVVTVTLSAVNDQSTQAVEALQQAKVPADFFVTGSLATKQAAAVGVIAHDGYAVYSQSYDGTDLATMKDADVQAAITRSAAAITAATGVTPKPIFRPPGGSYTAQTVKLLNGAGYCAVLWTVDAYDWKSGMTADQSLQRIMTAVGSSSGGVIIALHAGYDVTPTLIPLLVKALQDQHIPIVTLSTLLQS